MWNVRLELASVRLVEVNKKRRNGADLDFSAFWSFFVFHEKQSMEPNRRWEREGCASALVFFLVFSFLAFFRSNGRCTPPIDEQEREAKGPSKKKHIHGTGKNDADWCSLWLGLSVMPTKEWMTQRHPPPLADLNLFRHHPPLLMFARELEASDMTAGWRYGKELKKDRKTTDVLANAIDIRHILNFSTTPLILSPCRPPSWCSPMI